MSLPDAIVKRVGDRVAAHAGLRPPDWVLEARLERRLAALGMVEAEGYAALIESSDGARELQLLLEALRVGETRFFRHRAHVRAVADTVIPSLRRARACGAVRAWSAGCATGEEAYTLAILLARSLPAPAYRVSVRATDISSDALEVGRAAIYPEAALEQVPGELRRGAFAPAGEGRVRVAGQIARLVRFAQHNLTDPGYPTGLDLIFCRNVLIYFDAQSRRDVVRRLIDSLAPGGFLFVGYSESLREFEALEAVATPEAVLYRKPDVDRPPAAMRRLAPVAAAPEERRPAAPRAAAPAPALIDPGASTAIIELSGRYEGGERLTRELGALLSGGYRRVVIELDGAEYLDDSAGPVLRRAARTARSAGVEVILVAKRQGTRRWLSRSGALDEPHEPSCEAIARDPRGEEDGA